MKKKLIKVVSIVLTLVIGMTIGLAASGQLQKISAYLNYGVKIKYDGEVQNMFDANGVRVYPITYNGTTYLPVRAVADMMDVKVDWDGENNTVLLGNNGEYVDFIEEFTPFNLGGAYPYLSLHYKNSDGKTYKFGNETYSHYINVNGFGGIANYDLGGKYQELVLNIVCTDSDSEIKILGDNGVVIAELELKAYSWNREIRIPIYGVHQLTIRNDTQRAYGGGGIYILDAKIK